jgi:hypothetical protein
VDVHALRTTFGTLLSKGGVSPRTAQAAMRHSKIDLTMTAYTDPRLLDVRGALDALPALPLDSDREVARATGTGDVARTLAPTLAPTPDNLGQPPSFVDQVFNSDRMTTVGASRSPVKHKGPLTVSVSGPRSGGGGIRTRDLLNAIQTRSQLRHAPKLLTPVL